MGGKVYLAVLHSLGITHKKLHVIFGNNLLEKQKSYQEFYESLNREVLWNYAFWEKEITAILKRKEKLKSSTIEQKLQERNVQIITVKDKEYPEELRHITNSPYVLYVRWNISEGPKMAVVGARKITSYGKRVIETLIPKISNYFTIVSWGAFGCDTQAHLQALGAWNKTISVIGTSISEDYPTGNKKMYEDIVASWGAVVSIFPIGIPWSAYNFPVRNEIVAALSVGTIVVEAQERSGSLITSQLALDLGRDLFAIPWEIFKANSAGCNKLIKNGEAKPVSSALDVLEEYNFSENKSSEGSEKQKPEFSDELEEKVYNALLVESFTTDEIAKKLNLDITSLSFTLSMLEIKGIIKKTFWGKFEIK